MIVQHVFFHRPITKAGALGHWAGHRVSECGFYQAWRRPRTAAGCPGSIPHDFRRTASREFSRPVCAVRRVPVDNEAAHSRIDAYIPRTPQRRSSRHRSRPSRLRSIVQGSRARARCQIGVATIVAVVQRTTSDVGAARHAALCGPGSPRLNLDGERDYFLDEPRN
jgi:hypothetical protein